ncbi:PQQ-binding-like beta-propeller repeat protein [Micromonospora sp. NPDC000089]|uniref:outer membrane protein assembly factor BamB family protein n=1 Tax=unclassified Micromonospora TaxID=2617518 RepID=UPI0036943BE6
MTVIELGELRDEAGPEPPRRAPRPIGRPARAALVLVLALLALAGAAAPVRREVFAVAAPSGSAAFLSAGRLFVTEPAGPSAGRAARLSAYAVPAAGRGPLTPLWQAPIPFATPYGEVGVRDGVVLFVGGADAEGPYRTYAFDLATGERRWEEDGAGFDVPGGLLISEGEEPASRTLRFVELATGRVRWTLPVPGPVGYRAGPDGVDRIVTTPPGGPTLVYDARTGARLTAARIDPAALPGELWGQPVGDLLLLSQENATRLTAYGLDRLDRRWEARVGRVWYVSGCGPVLCAYLQPGGMRGLDPATGAVRWSSATWTGTLLERGGRLLVADEPGSGAEQRVAYLDAATGRVLAEPGRWWLVSRRPTDRRLVAVRRADDGRAVVAELDVAAARARVLDVLSGVAGACVADGDLLACRRSDAGYGVWRLR